MTFEFSYSCYLGVELLKDEGSETVLKSLWHHSDAILCCSLKVVNLFEPFLSFLSSCLCCKVHSPPFFLNGMKLNNDFSLLSDFVAGFASFHVCESGRT